MIGQLRSHETNGRRVSDNNNNISQLLRDSFSVSQQPSIWEPPSHYAMVRTLSVDIGREMVDGVRQGSGGASVEATCDGADCSLITHLLPL